MTDKPASQRALGRWLLALVAAGLLTAGAAAYFYRDHLLPTPPSTFDEGPVLTGTVEEQTHRFCTACHTFPPPDTFPRSAWPMEIEQAYQFFNNAGMPIQPPALPAVLKYYQDRAPDELPLPPMEKATTPLPVRFERHDFPILPGATPPHISNVNLVHLFDEKRLDVLACDMYHGLVMVLRPYEPLPKWQVLAKVPNPCHTEIVDLDGDGIKDILVANLGNFTPMDRRCGSVVWLRGKGDGTFTPIALLEDVGRVADVQAADFRGTGKLDLVVAVFGWRNLGEIQFLENQTTDWSKPKFVARIVDKRHGAIHVPVVDLNGDGKPDFISLISQEHETVVAFLNEGNGRFRKETLFTAPHPAYGSSGIQLVPRQRDGKIDVLYSNGDTLDRPYLLKPYHGIQWLEQQDGFRWVHHPVAPMYGVHRALAADFTGTGRKDIVAVSFLPVEGFPQRQEQNLDAVLYLEQTSSGKYARHALETGTCDHVTCAVGDIYGTGRMDIVTGTFTSIEAPQSLTIWKNLGK